MNHIIFLGHIIFVGGTFFFGFIFGIRYHDSKIARKLKELIKK